MDKVATGTRTDRAALFGETASRMGVASTIAEKDFWVCWTLKRVFELRKAGDPQLVFKGGTSLSKVYRAIRRFSEDIDLSFDRKELGYSGEKDPQTIAGTKARARVLDELTAEVKRHIAEAFLPALTHAFAEHLGTPERNAWSLAVDNADAQTVNFTYPSSLETDAYTNTAYVAPRVKLELGARGDPWPTEERTIVAYAAEHFPDLFEDPECSVTVLTAQRTFWEKATLLHAEAHRPENSPMPPRLSRHYYDLAMLLDVPEGQAAGTDFELLKQVAEHKSVFFSSARAKYDDAKPGTLRLVPPSARFHGLRDDYKAMAPMMFDAAPPAFDDLLQKLEELEKQINATA